MEEYLPMIIAPQVVQNIFPSNEELIKARLVTREELAMMEAEGDLEKLWWMPLCWGLRLVKM